MIVTLTSSCTAHIRCCFCCVAINCFGYMLPMPMSASSVLHCCDAELLPTKWLLPGSLAELPLVWPLPMGLAVFQDSQRLVQRDYLGATGTQVRISTCPSRSPACTSPPVCAEQKHTETEGQLHPELDQVQGCFTLMSHWCWPELQGGGRELVVTAQCINVTHATVNAGLLHD